MSGSQFDEPAHTEGKCPVCGKPVIVRSTREKSPYCSRVCASMKRFSKRYRGSLAGPMDRPEAMQDKTKFNS